MTRAAFLRVRRQYETLSVSVQAIASQRALWRQVFWWDGLTLVESQHLHGAVVRARLIHDEVP